MRKLIFLKSFIFIFALSFSTSNLVNASVADYKIGDKVQNFTIENYDGNTYSLNDLDAKATVVMFWSTECPFVQPYTDRVNKLADEFSSKGIVIWGINSNKTEPVDEVKTHAEKHAYTFPMLKDAASVVADQFGAQRTPEVFVIDNQTMTVIYHGRIDNDKEASKVTSNDLATALKQFLNGEKIAVEQTKAFGCMIKR